MARRRPNVIVIVSDTYRPDHIAANGHPFIKTPELDAFIQRSITFDRATVSSFPTIPMRTDWFTGRFSHPHHGWRDLAQPGGTLPAMLRQAGYTTQLIADTTHMLRSGFWKPFDSFHFLRGHEGDKPLSRLNDPIQRAVTDLSKTRVERNNTTGRPTLADQHVHTNFWRRYEDQSQIAQLADVACRWIEDNYRGGPFMLWLDCFDVHEPWCPPPYLWRMYDPDYTGDELMIHPNYGSADAYTAAELANMRALYAASCTLLAKHVGRVLRVIEDTGLLENTIVHFTCDHGTYLGERGRTGKSLIQPGKTDAFPMHCEISRICWSMHVPPSLGLNTVAPGTRLPDLAQAPDLLPTLLELCGIEPPEVGPPQDIQIEGASLVPAMTGQPSASPRDIAITTWTTQTHHAADRLFCRRPTVTDGQWTLLLSEPPEAARPRLYHVADDLTEQDDLFDQHADEARRLHAAMILWLKQHGAPADAIDRLSVANCGLGAAGIA